MVAFTVISGLLGVGGLAFALYAILTRLILGTGSQYGGGPAPFGDSLGLAVAFLPAWLISLKILLDRVAARRPSPAPEAA